MPCKAGGAGRASNSRRIVRGDPGAFSLRTVLAVCHAPLDDVLLSLLRESEGSERLSAFAGITKLVSAESSGSGAPAHCPIRATLFKAHQAQMGPQPPPACPKPPRFLPAVLAFPSIPSSASGWECRRGTGPGLCQLPSVFVPLQCPPKAILVGQDAPPPGTFKDRSGSGDRLPRGSISRTTSI